MKNVNHQACHQWCCTDCAGKIANSTATINLPETRTTKLNSHEKYFFFAFSIPVPTIQKIKNSTHSLNYCSATGIAAIAMDKEHMNKISWISLFFISFLKELKLCFQIKISLIGCKMLKNLIINEVNKSKRLKLTWINMGFKPCPYV